MKRYKHIPIGSTVQIKIDDDYCLRAEVVRNDPALVVVVREYGPVWSDCRLRQGEFQFRKVIEVPMWDQAQ